MEGNIKTDLKEIGFEDMNLIELYLDMNLIELYIDMNLIELYLNMNLVELYLDIVQWQALVLLALNMSILSPESEMCLGK
jgi:hypothetical protein